MEKDYRKAQGGMKSKLEHDSSRNLDIAAANLMRLFDKKGAEEGDKAILRVLCNRKEDIRQVQAGLEYMLPQLRGSGSEELIQSAIQALEAAFDYVLQGERFFIHNNDE
jgi:hypothetical protein